MNETLIRISLVACLLFAGSVGGATAQATEDMSDRGTAAQWGYQLSQYQDDFAVGLQLTSPHFAADRVSLRLRGNVAFHQHAGGGTSTWSPYGNASLVLTGTMGRVGESIRLYGEGGPIGLFPSSDFSTENVVFGGYGTFGFEFFASSGGSFFIEIGGIGTAAQADALPTAPFYSNGLLISAGFRNPF